jgi:hypothetical protein
MPPDTIYGKMLMMSLDYRYCALLTQVRHRAMFARCESPMWIIASGDPGVTNGDKSVGPAALS